MLDELLRRPNVVARSVLIRVKEIPSKGLPRLRRAQKDEFDRKHGVVTTRLVRVVPTDVPHFSHRE
jgi:hypothetical protein